MKVLPDVWYKSKYKYNIIARLVLLEGGVSNLTEKKKEIIDYLIARGAKESTIRKWFTIERGAKLEIPFSVLVSIKDFFNAKYQQMHIPNSLNTQNRFDSIAVEDLYFEGQLRIIASS
jgi:hypothetical protein